LEHVQSNSFDKLEHFQSKRFNKLKHRHIESLLMVPPPGA
jgi:hypothetical protein